MNAGNLFGGGRGGVFIRVGVILLVIITIFYFGFPHAQSAYEGYKSGKTYTPPPENDFPDPDLDFDLDEHVDLPPAHLSPTPTPAHLTPTPTHFPAPHETAEFSSHDDAVSETANDTCLHLPGANKIMVILKTGATELYQKLPVHFVTTLKCTPNFMIFSDLEQEFGGVRIRDAIKPVTKKRQQEHDDFKLYREIQSWWKEGQDLGKLKGDSGWNLDKWKFLPMFHEAFNEADESIDWFFMMEADTSISWLNLILWIQKLDPTKPYYMGAQNLLGDTTFGHGGSGVLMSRKAADVLEAARNNAGHDSYDEKWEGETAVTCCGDAIVARAFLDVEIPLTGSWPIIQGETVSTVDFSGNHWCMPPVTWHHVNALQVDAMWQFEKAWTDEHGWDTPYLYRDVFEHFVGPHISLNRTQWNNLSKDQKFVSPNLAAESSEFNNGKNFGELEEYEQKSVESEDACAEACSKKGGDCVQWMFQPGRCYLGRDVRYGASDERESEHWNSGWREEELKKKTKEFEGQSCEPRWIS